MFGDYSWPFIYSYIIPLSKVDAGVLVGGFFARRRIGHTATSEKSETSADALLLEEAFIDNHSILLLPLSYPHSRIVPTQKQDDSHLHLQDLMHYQNLLHHQYL